MNAVCLAKFRISTHIVVPVDPVYPRVGLDVALEKHVHSFFNGGDVDVTAQLKGYHRNIYQYNKHYNVTQHYNRIFQYKRMCKVFQYDLK